MKFATPAAVDGSDFATLISLGAANTVVRIVCADAGDSALDPPSIEQEAFA